MFTGTYPDITPAQIGAVALAIAGQLVAWGWLEKSREQLAVSVGTFVLSAVWKVADAYLRGKRNEAHPGPLPSPSPEPPAQVTA